jgi:hypothetical protein
MSKSFPDETCRPHPRAPLTGEDMFASFSWAIHTGNTALHLQRVICNHAAHA